MTIYKYAILPAITYASDVQKSQKQTAANSEILLHFYNKGLQNSFTRGCISNSRDNAIEQAVHLYKDIRAISRGSPTNAVITELKKMEIPNKIRGTHPKDNHIPVEFSGSEGNANVIIYTDGSKTENHVGASMVAVKGSRELHINTQRLRIMCTVFQAELYRISMAVDWIQTKERKLSPTGST
jgi:hypothetical protein